MKQVSLRYPDELIEPRIARLRPHVQKNNEGVTISDSKVKLIALLEGIRRLEEHYGIAPA